MFFYVLEQELVCDRYRKLIDFFTKEVNDIVGERREAGNGRNAMENTWKLEAVFRWEIS